MGMTYTSLIAAKGTAGSIANWVSYTKLDLATIVDEAQALIYQLLRVREMRTEYRFLLTENMAHVALPARFLDPIGKIKFTSVDSYCSHVPENRIQVARSYDEQSGTLGADPLTTTSGSNTVSVHWPAHGFTQDSIINLSGATAFNGATINGTFPVSAITDADNFTIDISALGTTPTASGAGGGAAVAYICDVLSTGMPQGFAIWDEQIKFEYASDQQTMAVLQYYQSLPLLSSSNASNFLTDRYPHLMRTACQTAAADFMKDDTEYQKCFTRLGALIQGISAENDGVMRGMELDTEIP